MAGDQQESWELSGWQLEKTVPSENVDAAGIAGWSAMDQRVPELKCLGRASLMVLGKSRSVSKECSSQCIADSKHWI